MIIVLSKKLFFNLKIFKFLFHSHRHFPPLLAIARKVDRNYILKFMMSSVG